MFTSLETASLTDWQTIDSPANREAELNWTCENLLGLIRTGLASGNTFGWPINCAQHCLQTATRAYRANADDETVFCALFHDATEMIDAHNHAASASVLLEPYISPENCWMVRHHGLFQNYHARNHPRRFSTERDQHRGHPAYERTVQFCAEFDECSFDPSYEAMTLDDFRPLVEDFVITRPK